MMHFNFTCNHIGKIWRTEKTRFLFGPMSCMVNFNMCSVSCEFVLFWKQYMIGIFCVPGFLVEWDILKDNFLLTVPLNIDETLLVHKDVIPIVSCRLGNDENSGQSTSGLFVCAVCQVDLAPSEGISVHAGSIFSTSSKPWQGPFLCCDCRNKKDAMEGKRPSGVKVS
jgi:hypothetical protein